MLTIVFYHNNGPAAKHRAREIAATSKGNYARCYDASVWEGTADKCDNVEIMPDVPSWQRDRICSVYGPVEEAVVSDDFVEEQELVRTPMGDLPPRKEENGKSAVHKGGGRWFVMLGDERISGPHDKIEAMRLAALTEE